MKFSIRDLFLVTMIVALGLGWWLDDRTWVEAYSNKGGESKIWEARANELQVRTEILAERSRGAPIPTPSLSAPSPSGTPCGA
jgi:hypothetical protein